MTQVQLGGYWTPQQAQCDDVTLHLNGTGQPGVLPVRSSSHNLPRRHREGIQVQLYSFFNMYTRWGWVVNATARPLYPRERESVPTVQEAGWAPGPVWTGAENLAPTGIRSPERPVRTLSRHTGCYSSLNKATT